MIYLCTSMYVFTPVCFGCLIAESRQLWLLIIKSICMYVCVYHYSSAEMFLRHKIRICLYIHTYMYIYIVYMHTHPYIYIALWLQILKLIPWTCASSYIPICLLVQYNREIFAKVWVYENTYRVHTRIYVYI